MDNASGLWIRASRFNAWLAHYALFGGLRQSTATRRHRIAFQPWMFVVIVVPLFVFLFFYRIVCSLIPNCHLSTEKKVCKLNMKPKLTNNSNLSNSNSFLRVIVNFTNCHIFTLIDQRIDLFVLQTATSLTFQPPCMFSKAWRCVFFTWLAN